MAEKESKLAIVRIRGRVHVRGGIEDTLRMLNLTRKNHCVLLDKTPVNQGMIHKINDYITWGELSEKTLVKMLSERGRLAGNEKLSDENINKASKHKTIKDFAKTLLEGKSKISDVAGLKPVFRLKPPEKGFERGGIKKSFPVGGALGYRGEKINDLIERML